MSSQEDTTGLSIRQAVIADVPAIVALVLTSFRTFPLFTFLYSPIYDDINNARDTVFFWSRRVELALYDPSSIVMVAEMPCALVPVATKSEDAMACRMWDWVREVAGLSQVSDHGRKNIVGFAIWRWKCIQDLSQVGVLEPWSLLYRVWSLYASSQVWFYTRFYSRKDQHHQRYAAYVTAEEDAEEKYYTTATLNLDNLCTDFRTQGRGVGRALLQWGINRADQCGLPVQTEASPQGFQFYRRFGLQKIGEWEVKTAQEPGHSIALLVLRVDPTDAV